MSEYHNPVLLEESVSAIIGDTSGVYADATFGGGGHSALILSRLSRKGRLLAFDRDADALENAPADKRLTLIHNNFRFIHNFALLHEVEFDGILADLGVSSHQFDTEERGFSFRFDTALDMRMNADGGRTAADVVNDSTVERLEEILRLYGEVENAGKVAKLIDAARRLSPIRTTGDLNKAVESALPPYADHKWLAKLYQALRIEVNEEMRSLEKFLQGAAESLKQGGKLAVITYHSLEDRMVKNFIKTGNVEGNEQRDVYGNNSAPLKAVNRKPILPTEEEIQTNTRARSAKLRIAEKN
ncbi:MAG: 16S rRNA (cytosine(1402)-N(4))-methyltransferase RsmH [Bacteroidales bacterium]|nr:16S rRNA (cytosine(1402)-N(4))-methyltransferase RsmH [Bacteroidales bacterium]MBP5538097.1 16S rRNA (cytosine(1402)-N(4))-methyltransferase RsmH [Bacteroidales bacterium]